jgi:hypothetical protein
MNWVKSGLPVARVRGVNLGRQAGASLGQEGEGRVGHACRRAFLSPHCAQRRDEREHGYTHCQAEHWRALSLLVLRRVAFDGIARLD